MTWDDELNDGEIAMLAEAQIEMGRSRANHLKSTAAMDWNDWSVRPLSEKNETGYH